MMLVFNFRVLFFSRVNNFGGKLSTQRGGSGVTIWKNKVYFLNLHGEKSSIDLDRVIFASTDQKIDTNHFHALESQYKVPRHRLVMLRTPEELFSVINASNHIFSDRYHPIVASIRMSKNSTTIYYFKVLVVLLFSVNSYIYG
jgi:hypothetical protein